MSDSCSTRIQISLPRWILPTVGLALLLSGLGLGRAVNAAQDPSLALRGRHGVTVYVDTHAGAKTKRAARKMTELHAEQAALGFTVIDVAPYTEDGDLKGFYVTYVKD